MALKPMKTLTIGDKQYEVIDALARANVTELQENIDNTLPSLQNKVNEHDSDSSAHSDIRDSIPTKVSQLENDSKYLTIETDPTVPAWAKAANKPVYTAEEVGADSVGTATNAVLTHNSSTDAHSDIRDLLSDITTKLNNFLDVDDTTADQLSEVLQMIEDNEGTIESLTTSKVNVSDIINNLTTNVANKPLSAAQGVILKGLIDELEAAVEQRALTSDLTAHTENENNPHGVTTEQIGALSLSGGTMTGEITIGQGDGNGIQLGTNGRINATSGSSTTATIAGVDGTKALFGHSSFSTTIRGKDTRPTYNGKNMALETDAPLVINVKPGTYGDFYPSTRPTFTDNDIVKACEAVLAGRVVVANVEGYGLCFLTKPAKSSTSSSMNPYETNWEVKGYFNDGSFITGNYSYTYDYTLSSPHNYYYSWSEVNTADTYVHATKSNLTSHTGNKNNPHGVTLSQLGVTATAAELNYVDGVTSNIQTQLSQKANDYSIELYNGTSGNPKPVRFASFNYSTCNSENGIAAKISMVSGHGNGSSYAFLQDAIIKVNHTGSVEVDNLKYYGASAGTYDGASRQYGDIFWLVDSTNKIIDFYCLMGQYARVQMTPWKRLTHSSGGAVTQHTSCTVYSSGEKNWANNSNFAMKSDLPINISVRKTNGAYSCDVSIDAIFNLLSSEKTVVAKVPSPVDGAMTEGHQMGYYNYNRQSIDGDSINGVCVCCRLSDGSVLNGKRESITNGLTGVVTTSEFWQLDTSNNKMFVTKSNAETWTFTLEDGSTVTKKVVLG